VTSPTGIAPVLQVHPTRRCNLACAHCYSSSGPTLRKALDVDLLSGCLEDAAALGYRQLAVSGGEPLLYDRLAELLARARALGMLTSVTSNGMLATAERWGTAPPQRAAVYWYDEVARRTRRLPVALRPQLQACV
jgi:MoaA/NifB/PqqE/SkfB family radical SAM enzyme